MSTMAKTTKPRRARRQLTDEFKAGAVRLVLDEGQTVGRVARDLDLTESAVRTWVERARADRTKGRTLDALSGGVSEHNLHAAPCDGQHVLGCQPIACELHRCFRHFNSPGEHEIIALVMVVCTVLFTGLRAPRGAAASDQPYPIHRGLYKQESQGFEEPSGFHTLMRSTEGTL